MNFKVSEVIKNKLYYGATPHQAQAYEDFIKAHKITREYEKLNILRIITSGGMGTNAGGFRYGSMSDQALQNLLGRGLVCIDKNGLAQLM